MRVAVVGGGVAGIVAAYNLQKTHEVSIFDANDYLGGHTNTRTIEAGSDKGTRVDTGFIVLNDQTYPNFHQFLSSLGVPVRYSDMSFSYWCQVTGLQYAGTNFNGLFAQRKNIVSPVFLSFLLELRRFCKESLLALGRGELELSMGEFLKSRGYSQYFINSYLLPMGSAIWSAPLQDILDFPAKTFVEFFRNHGLLSIKNRPQWQTVVGGSQAYVEKFRLSFNGKIFCNRRIATIKRTDRNVTLVDRSGSVENFDRVVIAAHADQALKMLEQPTELETQLLGSWSYKSNYTVLHTDIRLLPPLRNAWASWNYINFGGSGLEAPVAVTYYMNKLQGLKTQEHYCVSLNCPEQIDRSKIIYEVDYTHPVFSGAAVATQSRLQQLQGINNSYFCGSYFGYGFHEDAVKAGLEAARLLDRNL